jgi:hypothetical protein
MSMTYTWKIVGLTRKNEPDHPNTVVNVRWQKIGTDSANNVGYFEGATPFVLDPAANNFIAYEDLTEETLLSWVKPKVVNDYEEHVNERIEFMIEDELRQTGEIDESNLPWSS